MGPGDAIHAGFADYYLPGIKGVSAYVVMLVVLFVRPEGLIVQTYQKKV